MREALVPVDVGRVRFDPVKSLWLWGLALPGLWIGAPALDAVNAAVALALSFLTLCVGHSVGLHRGIIHHSYETSPLVRGVLSWLFVLSGLGGPLSWARLHAVRDYWQNRADCPRWFAYDHGLLLDLGWNLHFRFDAADARADGKLPSDVLAAPRAPPGGRDRPGSGRGGCCGLRGRPDRGRHPGPRVRGLCGARVGRASPPDPGRAGEGHEPATIGSGLVRRGLPQQPPRVPRIGAVREVRVAPPPKDGRKQRPSFHWPWATGTDRPPAHARGAAAVAAESTVRARSESNSNSVSPRS